MNGAEYFLCLIGVTALIFLLVLFGSWCIYSLFDWKDDIHQPSYVLGREDERAANKHRLAQDARWFSESTATRNLLANLAGGVSVGEARDIWRNERETELQPYPNI